jgi:2-methylisocitrate lyase-like PEP mutase family enzyme
MAAMQCRGDAALANAVRIIGATGLPVAADLENGYGAAPEACAETIRQAIAIGLSGGSIEDSTGEDGEAIFDIGAATDRVRAAVEAARGSGRDFVLTARAENFLHGRRDLHDTITRLQGLSGSRSRCSVRARDCARLTRSGQSPHPLTVLSMSSWVSRTYIFRCPNLRSLASSASASAVHWRARAIGAFMTAAREMADSGTFTFGDSAMPHADVNRLFMPKH